MNKLILAAAVLLSSTFVQAQTFRDWKVVQETDAVLQVPVCRAYTQVVSNLPIPVELSLSFPTAFDKVPTMILKVPGNSLILKAVVPLSSRESEDFLTFQAVSDPTQQDKLWYVPIQMEKLVDIIIGNNTLPLQFTLANKEESGRISLTGSTAAMRQIATCLRVSEILPRKFFKELNTAAGSANLGPDQSVTQLMLYVDQAFTHFQEMAKTDADLAKLRQSMRPLVTQETDAQNKLNTAQANLDRATATMNATAEKIRNGELRLQQIPAEIQALQAQKPAADQLLAQKKAAFDPLRAERQRLQANIDSAQRDVSFAENAIDSRERLIRDNESKISNLQSEANRLDREVDSLQQELSRLERRKSELEADLASYNVELEKQKILQNNGRYQQLKNEKAGLPQQIRQKRQDLNQAQSRLQRAEAALRTCRGNVTNPTCDNEKQAVRQAENHVQRAQDKLNRCQGGNSRDCREKERAVRQAERQVQKAEQDLRRCEAGGNSTNPNINCDAFKTALEREKAELTRAQAELATCQATAPNCDAERTELNQAQAQLQSAKQVLRQCESNVVVPRCDAEENEVNAARREVNQLQNELNNLESRLNSIDSEISRIETDAQNQAARGHQELADELRRVAGQVADKRSEKERAEDRIREINNSEIPNLRNEISRAQGELPGLRRDLANAQRDLSNAQSEYRRWKASVDYDRIEREYLDAKKAVDDIVNGIASKQSEQTQINRNLPTWRQQLTQQTAEVNRLTPLRDTAKTKLDGIQTQLAPMRAQEKTMTDLLATLKPQYEELRKLYQTLAKLLLGS